MGLLKTALLAIMFGSLYTIFRKYQSIVNISPPNTQFNQPMYFYSDKDYKVLLSLSACLPYFCFDLG